jgi:hypothetical protein
MESNPYRLVVELRGSEKTLADEPICSEQRDFEPDARVRERSAGPGESGSGSGLGGEGIRPAGVGKNRKISHRARRRARRLGLGHGWAAGIAGERIWCST